MSVSWLAYPIATSVPSCRSKSPPRVGQHERAVDGRGPNDVPVHQPVQMLTDGIAVIGSLANLGVDVAREQHRIRRPPANRGSDNASEMTSGISRGSSGNVSTGLELALRIPSIDAAL